MFDTMSFHPDYKTSDIPFVNFTHLRDCLRSIAFAPKYRVRTFQNEFGRVIKRQVLGVRGDGSEFEIGGLV